MRDAACSGGDENKLWICARNEEGKHGLEYHERANCVDLYWYECHGFSMNGLIEYLTSKCLRISSVEVSKTESRVYMTPVL